MKKSVRYSALMLSVILMLGGCAPAGTEQDQSEGSAVQSSTVQSESTTQESMEASKSSETESKTEESSKKEESSGTDTKDESSDDESTQSDVGAGEITVKEASADNTQLSSGTYQVTIGNKTVTLSGAYVVDGIDAVIDGGEWSSSTADQNVFLVINGGSMTLKNAAITKTGDASTNDSTRKSDVSDDYNFYGINSVILTVGENSTATIENCTITSDCSGANTIFSLDEANIELSNVSISTTGNSSRGVYATYGGVITADHLDITTTGAHCAPIATDRGGGYVTVKNSKFNSSGDGSPNIYSTGEIVVENCVGISTGSQAAVIEGKNSITMTNCNFTISGSGNNGVMLYQSMSGDAADSDATASVSTLTMSNTTITSELDGPMFYITNTSSVINLNGGNTLTAKSGDLVSAGTGRWGKDGSNGGKLTLNISGECYSDSITADDISTVIVNLSDSAEYTGTTFGSVTIQ